jgi:hypothetical protein
MSNSEKLFYVYIKYLFPITNPQNIQFSLADEGRNVIRFTNIIKRNTKSNLPLFRISLKITYF